MDKIIVPNEFIIWGFHCRAFSSNEWGTMKELLCIIIYCHISFKMKVDEDLREPNFTQRQMLLSAALPVLEDALTPSKEVFVFPRDLVLSNTIVMDVLLTLAYGVAQEVGIDTLQTVRTTIFVFFCVLLEASQVLLPASCS